MTPDELRSALVGAWRLVSFKATALDTGDVVEPFGARARGILIYTADAQMSAQIMRPDRPEFRQPRLEEGEPDELVAAATGYMAYGGTWDVSEGNRVTHKVTLSLFPNWVGATLARIAEWDGELLNLVLPEPAFIWGARRSGVLTWERPS
ncbi:lipocalin-like domain-containing protein [Actinospica robiniae]|uniref:lipocalin-like domain-containing protein n=1 Tax=Actinospica robiniae TaxID=304901 RepID=UPI0004023473|nr:lipocalin-like domain-containing protein [Actinospica robiniae]